MIVIIMESSSINHKQRVKVVFIFLIMELTIKARLKMANFMEKVSLLDIATILKKKCHHIKENG